MLCGILLVALILRLWGIRFGLPYFEHPDEWAVADEALRMLTTGNFSPHSYVYPTLYVYLQVIVAALHYITGFVSGTYQDLTKIDPASYYVWARSLTALLGTGLVLLTYLVGRRIFNATTGLIAAALLAVLPTAVGDAHYVTVDTPAAFFGLLAFLAIVRLAPGPCTGERPLALFLAALLVGLATSTKYTLAVLVVPLLLAIWYALPPEPNGQRLRRLIQYAGWSACGGVLGFTLGTPLWLVEFPRLLADLASIAEHYRTVGHAGAESSRPWLFYWVTLANEASLIAWAALLGAAVCILRRQRGDLLLLALVIPFVVQLSSVRVVFFRNAVPLLPYACLLAALALVFIVRNLNQRLRSPEPITQGILALGIVGFVLQPFPHAIRDNWLRAQPTTRVLATEWMLAQAPAGTRIWLEDQTLILPRSLRVQGGKPLTDHPLPWYRENGYRFLVANASLQRSDPARLAEFGTPVAQFSANEQRYGHTFSIYDTGLAAASVEIRTGSGASLAGGALLLDGYRQPGQVRAGQVLPIALYWQVQQALPTSYTVFVHLVDASDAKVAQRDTAPLDGSRPTTGWQPGELLRDDQDLAIPDSTPPGTYRLLVGMYDSTTFVSINDNGPIFIGTVTVQPP